MGFGKSLGKLLKDSHISVKELSNRAGIPATTLYSLINRDGNINNSNLTKIAQALNMPLYKLLGWDSEEEMNYCSNMYEDYLSKDTNSKDFVLFYLLDFIIDDLNENCIKVVYSDGTLEATQEELTEIEKDIRSYARFKMNELKENNNDKFKPFTE